MPRSVALVAVVGLAVLEATAQAPGRVRETALAASRGLGP
jgi:hypothetical protein